jgi:MSHA biogenesis protein MshJ
MNQLKQQWIKLSTKLDAMTLRERALVFVAVTASLLFLIYTIAVEPMLARQAALRTEISQQQNQVNGIDIEIAAKAQGFVVDPDAEGREHLHRARADIERISSTLLAVQKGLVAPDRIAPLLEHLLRGNGKLTLVSMKTLPVAGMNDAASASSIAAPASAATTGAATAATTGATTAAAPVALPAPATAATPPVAKPRELLYRHGVEIVVQGGYLDMVAYMQALEALPVQLFWGAARLDAQQYPDARLTLTLYTLSLDEKWMKL